MGYHPEELFSLIQGRKLVVRYYDGRVRIYDNQSGVADMSKIKEVTDFMRDGVKEIQTQAEEIHGVAMQVKDQAKNVLGMARQQLDEAQKELMELQASMGGSTNFPPPSEEPPHA